MGYVRLSLTCRGYLTYGTTPLLPYASGHALMHLQLGLRQQCWEKTTMFITYLI